MADPLEAEEMLTGLLVIETEVSVIGPFIFWKLSPMVSLPCSCCVVQQQQYRSSSAATTSARGSNTIMLGFR